MTFQKLKLVLSDYYLLNYILIGWKFSSAFLGYRAFTLAIRTSKLIFRSNFSVWKGNLALRPKNFGTTKPRRWSVSRQFRQQKGKGESLRTWPTWTTPSKLINTQTPSKSASTVRWQKLAEGFWNPPFLATNSVGFLKKYRNCICKKGKRKQFLFNSNFKKCYFCDGFFLFKIDFF